MQYAGPDGTLSRMQGIRAELDQGILTVALHRLEQRNLIDVATSLEMHALLQAVHQDAGVRVLVLRGDGPGFSAGMDTQDFEDGTRRDAATLRAAVDAANEWRVRVLRLLPQPAIAMVHGFCEAGAMAVLAGCDIVLAADDTAFSVPERNGIPGRSFDSGEAERTGVITRSVPAAELEEETYALARDFVAKDAIAVQFTKETLLHVPDMTWDGVLNFTAAKFAELKALQAGRPSTRAAAVASFLAGKIKPGLGA